MNLGFENSINIINSANSCGKYVIISTMFESCVGLSGLLYLASLVNHKYSHGIGSYLNVDQEILNYKFTPVNGFITYDNAIDFRSLDIMTEDEL